MESERLCASCSNPLENTPSDYFCNMTCQENWNYKQVAPLATGPFVSQYKPFNGVVLPPNSKVAKWLGA